MVRPFRRADLLRAIDSAQLDSTSSSGRLALALRQEYRQEDAEAWGRVEGRIGGQAYSNARLDVVHPLGPDCVQPYASLGLTAVFGPIAAVARPRKVAR